MVFSTLVCCQHKAKPWGKGPGGRKNWMFGRRRSRETPGNDVPRACNANRGDFPTYSVSRHDLWPADSLCTRSPVLCERFKWEINIKRPFTAPSNKQLDSSFWYAPFLRPLSTLLGVASRVQIFNASTPQRFTLKRRFVFSDLFLFKHAIASVSSFLQISSLQFLKF